MDTREVNDKTKELHSYLKRVRDEVEEKMKAFDIAVTWDYAYGDLPKQIDVESRVRIGAMNGHRTALSQAFSNACVELTCLVDNLNRLQQEEENDTL